MKIVGTHDEIMYIVMQCQKRTDAFCKGCVLSTFCSPQMFKRLNPYQLDIIESGRFEEMLLEPVLIPKGGNNVSQVQQSSD